MTNPYRPIARSSRMIIQFLLFTLLQTLSAVAVAEGNSTRQYNIPPQSLSSALQAFSDSSHLQLLYDANLVAGLTSPFVKGAYTPQQALTQLLGQSGLSYQIKSARMVTLTKRTVTDSGVSANENLLPVVQVTAKADDNSGGDTTLPKVTVEADADNPYDDPTWQTDPYNTDYVLPKATAGTKTNTLVMETPLNVQVITKQVLTDQQVISLDKALKNVSGVTLNSNFLGSQTTFLRGFEAVALFRNGVRFDNNTGFANAPQFANVESVEVLKGPAAILYGRVEPGGMVNITTKQPLATPYYSFNQQFGSYDLFRTSIDATGPLTKDDTLLYRVNASFQSNNSFRELVSGENVFFAPTLKWNISPRTQVTLEVEYQRDLSIQNAQSLPFDGTRVIDNIPGSRNFGERNPQETENIFVGLNWSHQFNNDWALKHQVAFKRNDVNLGHSLLPFDFNLDTREVGRSAFRGNFVDDTVATILDLTGHFNTWGLEHTVLVGGDYYRFDSSDGAVNGNDTSTISLDNPVHPGTPVPLLEPIANPPTQGVDNYGFYLQDQIKLPYHFLVTGGFRYQNVHSVNSSGFGTNGGSASTITTDDAVTPRVGLVWHPQSWVSLYSNYVENFGANTGKFAFVESSDPAAGTPLRPETAQQWEVGVKTEFFDGRLRATLAYYDLTKQNVATADPLHPASQGFCAGNGCSIAAGEVNSNGPELDIQGEILPGWNVIATYANQNVRITKSENGDVGNRLQFVPRNTGSVWSTYEVQKGDLKGFKIGGGVNLQDSVVDASNTIKSPGYALVSLLAGYSFEVGKSKITAQLNIDNLLNKNYFSNAASFGNGVDVNFSTPRTFIGSIMVEY